MLCTGKQQCRNPGSPACINLAAATALLADRGVRVVTIALGEEADPGIEELARSAPGSVLRDSSGQGDGREELLCSGHQPARGHEVTLTGPVFSSAVQGGLPGRVRLPAGGGGGGEGGGAGGVAAHLVLFHPATAVPHYTVLQGVRQRTRSLLPHRGPPVHRGPVGGAGPRAGVPAGRHRLQPAGPGRVDCRYLQY